LGEEMLNARRKGQLHAENLGPDGYTCYSAAHDGDDENFETDYREQTFRRTDRCTLNYSRKCWLEGVD